MSFDVKQASHREANGMARVRRAHARWLSTEAPPGYSTHHRLNARKQKHGPGRIEASMTLKMWTEKGRRRPSALAKHTSLVRMTTGKPNGGLRSATNFRSLLLQTHVLSAPFPTNDDNLSIFLVNMTRHDCMPGDVRSLAPLCPHDKTHSFTRHNATA
jgi:hypothetical protein